MVRRVGGLCCLQNSVAKSVHMIPIGEKKKQSLGALVGVFGLLFGQSGLGSTSMGGVTGIKNWWCMR